MKWNSKCKFYVRRCDWKEAIGAANVFWLMGLGAVLVRFLTHAPIAEKKHVLRNNKKNAGVPI